MEKLKVLSVFGTRPEAIKMAPLIKELERCAQIESFTCVTAQHRQMLDQVLSAFSMRPDFDLDIMEREQTLFTITTKVLTGLEVLLKEHRFDLLLVHGDTTTTFASSLAAFYSGVKCGHVEAGLRTNDRLSPYPEEMNRRLTGRIADLHFAPTAQNLKNLQDEGIRDNIFVTGNTAIDALKTTVRDGYTFDCPELNAINWSGGRKVITLTAHRRENQGQPMEDIMSAVRYIALNHDVQVVFPVHLSPYVTRLANERLLGLSNVLLVKPLGVLDMHNLMARSDFIMTDSGGMQEEAPSLGKPVLVLRRETERQEAVAAGTVELCGTRYDDIVKAAERLLYDQEYYKRMARAVNPYGDGGASARIVQNILYSFALSDRPAADFSPL